MLLNYLKLSFRLLGRNPFFTVINVVGLAIGFASFYALWEYSTADLKADRYHKDADRIARIGVNWRWTDDGGESWGHLVFGFARSALSPQVKDDFPEVESTLRIMPQEFFTQEVLNHGDKITISIDDQNGTQRIFKEDKVAYADPNLFDFFSIPLIYGQAQDVLKEANNVMLSHSTARKYFGEKDPTGKLLKLNDTITLKVSGVYEDLPHYSHLNFELVISNASVLNRWNTSTFDALNCYVKLNSTDYKDFEAKLNQQIEKYWGEVLRQRVNTKLDMFVQPLEEIPFSENFVGDNFHPKSKPFLFTLAFIALSVLAMAWVNYINLSVTRTTRRFKEIATRKVSGAVASDMIIQFVTEALVTNALALALAFTLIQIVRTPVAALFNIQIAAFSSLRFDSIAIFVSIIVAGILVSALYPAVISMAYQPRALFNMSSPASGKQFIPFMLTISQLAAAIIFILLGFTVSTQLNHILNMDTGIKTDQVIIIEAPVIKPTNYSTAIGSLKKSISDNSSVVSVTCSRFLVQIVNGGGFDAKRIGSDLAFGMDNNFVDEDFIHFYGLKLIAGREFIKDDKTDGVIISRYAAARLGFKSPEDAVGSKINVRTVINTDWKEAEVIGVIENFRNTSFLNMSESSTEANTGRGAVLLYKDRIFKDIDSEPENISVRASSKQFGETIHAIEILFKREFPSAAFTWYFLDDKMNEVYAHEKVARNQIVLFTGLALLIASIGLLGMISNKAVEKTKEIGIRKVLGARLYQILRLLLDSTVKQIVIATIIGIPVAYYLTQLYLEKFSEKITLQWWHFVLPLLLLVVILFLTIASVLFKAAKNNPVEALKYE
ncbi:MAG TPA: ABC transporter permease [Cyclobacteriaceae bacterium]|nr:ABC transporter permease [Cyclobacteriaceae bacterium]